MATEIEYAVKNGIDHWAFVVYPPEIAMSQSLAAYLSSTSPLKSSLSFCLNLQSAWMTRGGLAAWPSKVSIYIEHFRRTEYRLVLNDRPLVYIFSIEEAAWGGSMGWSDWYTALAMLANASLSVGLGAPYYVVQTWSAAQGKAQIAAINAAGHWHGGDPLVSALSAYALGGATLEGTPFTTFANSTVAFWESLKSTGFSVVPPIAAGWDQRPRVECPPPWVPHPDASYVQVF